MGIEKLYTAINTNDIKEVKKLLEEGVNPNIVLSINDDASWGSSWGTVGDAISEITQGASKDILLLLLNYGADIDMSYDEKSPNPLIAASNFGLLDLNLIRFLLISGANPNKYYGAEFTYTLQIDSENDDEYNKLKLLLKYGGQYNDAENHIRFPRFNELQNATWNGRLKEIKLLLDYGADTMSIDEDGYMIKYGDCKDMVLDDIKLTIEECQELLNLLNPNNPPYLKLSESDEDKYIIYVNELIEKEGYLPYAKPYLLADKQKHKEKKYLYADNKIDAFVYWCYTNNLLSESVIPGVKLYEEKLAEINYKNIHSFITSVIGDKVTTDIFNEEGKAFATSYLTVTHWWYNLHTDFNRLYQDENIKLPRAIKSQEEFDTLMKLLDIRHEQFISGKDFNSNQNKAELEALIEGKEPPKRVVDLSFLEDDNTKTPKEKSNNDTDIIPDDFFKNN